MIKIPINEKREGGGEGGREGGENIWQGLRSIFVCQHDNN